MRLKPGDIMVPCHVVSKIIYKMYYMTKKLNICAHTLPRKALCCLRTQPSDSECLSRSTWGLEMHLLGLGPPRSFKKSIIGQKKVHICTHTFPFVAFACKPLTPSCLTWGWKHFFLGWDLRSYKKCIMGRKKCIYYAPIPCQKNP